MAESQQSLDAPAEMQKELEKSESENTTKPVTDETNNASASNSQPSGGSDNLEDLLRTLSKQINNSDWLEKNTAEKWVQENPDIAQPFMDAAKKS